MSEPAKKKATYEDLYGVPENMTGEIIYGELTVTPRPSTKHILTTSALNAKIIPPYYFGDGGGPGGWIILIGPEIALVENILVPDLAGWKRDRFPKRQEHNWIDVVPDWVCEVLSPSTALRDRTKKMAIYAEYGVGYLWFIDPVHMTVDIFRLESSRWVPLGVFGGNEKVRLEPFQQIEIDLGHLWLVP
ncbi:MAG: Uma2 family endonuclease [Deltaproteobacteria bacterium]|nr:Uma2 family endonuclease [Deltaproteobacteria bacterium]